MRFQPGDRVKIDPAARTLHGSVLGHDETTGTVASFHTHPHGGHAYLVVSTDGGTDVTVSAADVTPVPSTVPASWTVEVFGPFGWEPVAPTRGRGTERFVNITATQAALDSFAITQAGKARMPHRRVRVTIATADGGLVAWHEESGTKMPEDPRQPRLHALVVLATGRQLQVSVGSERARQTAAAALAADPHVAEVNWLPGEARHAA